MNTTALKSRQHSDILSLNTFFQKLFLSNYIQFIGFREKKAKDMECETNKNPKTNLFCMGKASPGVLSPLSISFPLHQSFYSLVVAILLLLFSDIVP